MFKDRKLPYVIAEIGGNHEGSLSVAKDLVASAAEAGADAVKFQILSPNGLVSDVHDHERFLHFERLALQRSDFDELADFAESVGIDFCASIWDSENIKHFKDRMPFIKVGSGDLTAYPLLREIALLGKPIVLSTGLSHLAEVINSVDFIRSVNSAYNDKDLLSLLQCTASYPCPVSDVNLNVMDVLSKATGCLVGYSHHALNSLPILVAASMGAHIIEVHFTFDRSKESFRDHQLSFEKDDLVALIGSLKEIVELKGTFDKRPTEAELAQGNVVSFRRSLFLKRNVSVGSTFSWEDFVCLRPNVGVPAERIQDFIGRTASRDLKAGDIFHSDMVD